MRIGRYVQKNNMHKFDWFTYVTHMCVRCVLIGRLSTAAPATAGTGAYAVALPGGRGERRRTVREEGAGGHQE